MIMGDQFFWRGDDGSNAADLAELVKSRGLSAGLLGNPIEEEFIPQTGIIETDDQGNFVRIIESQNWKKLQVISATQVFTS